METIQYIKLNGVVYELVPADHVHTLEEIEDFSTDLSKYDNSTAKFVNSTNLATKQNKALYGTSTPSSSLGEDGDLYIMVE